MTPMLVPARIRLYRNSNKRYTTSSCLLRSTSSRAQFEAPTHHIPFLFYDRERGAIGSSKLGGSEAAVGSYQVRQSMTSRVVTVVL